MLPFPDNPTRVFSIGAWVVSPRLNVSIHTVQSAETSSMISRNCTPIQNNYSNVTCDIYLKAFVDREVCLLVFAWLLEINLYEWIFLLWKRSLTTNETCICKQSWYADELTWISCHFVYQTKYNLYLLLVYYNILRGSDVLMLTRSIHLITFVYLICLCISSIFTLPSSSHFRMDKHAFEYKMQCIFSYRLRRMRLSIKYIFWISSVLLHTRTCIFSLTIISILLHVYWNNRLDNRLDFGGL